ncbi:hypothetical protein DFH27DRAFT_539346 [Peziza echinospora]|nr:hypothetical protein DFH27DRAFT_539346 [Peziza echinospora]
MSGSSSASRRRAGGGQFRLMRVATLGVLLLSLCASRVFATPIAAAEPAPVPVAYAEPEAFAAPAEFELVPRAYSAVKVALAALVSGGLNAVIEPADGQATFDSLKSRWSDWMNPGVATIVQAATEQDVVRTIQWANANNRTFFVQNTGHGWANFTSVKNAILIKVNTFKTISIDTTLNRATVGAGVEMGELIKALFAVQRQTTLGTCDCPGVIGALLGGGHGRLQGMYGLLLDQLVSARIILHDGSIIEASDSQNPDLFWGLRGAGHNFGVVMSVVLKVYPVEVGGFHYNAVTYYEDWQLESIFTLMNSITLPDRASAYVLFFSDAAGKSYIAIDFTYAGRVEDGQTLLKYHFDVGLPQRTLRQEKVIPWSDLNKEGMLGIAQNWCIRGWRKNTHSTGMISYNIPDVRTVWNGYRTLIQQNPAAFQSMYIWETYPMQGMRNRDWTTTAYSNRDIMHIVVAFLIYESPSLDAAMTAYGENAFRNVLNSHNGYNGKPRVYVNYGHGGAERKAEFYGWDSWRQQKLMNLKLQYDPKGRFNGYHPIPTAIPGFTNN